jgi:alkylation response protein AidB-like acyl-CoA dehydrogenase
VDFAWNDDQRAILAAVDALCAQHAGAARAVELDAKATWDEPLDAALCEAGFADVALGAPDTGPLEAAMVVAEVARHAGTLPIGAQVLVAPALLGRALPAPVALVSLAHPGPVRFGAHARTALVDCGDEARVVSLAPGDATPVRSNFMLPVGALALDARAGESLGPGSGAALRAWWRVALAAELYGTMQAALDVTVAYVKRRRQFGRAIGSFQALQHRLAMCTVQVESTRWLAFEAASQAQPSESAAVAAAYAAEAANQVFRETHQLSGAMGFTREHDLHVFSMRSLRCASSSAAHRRTGARSRRSAGSRALEPRPRARRRRAGDRRRGRAILRGSLPRSGRARDGGLAAARAVAGARRAGRARARDTGG